MNNENYQPIIGLEIHVELKTNSKMFCGCRADWFGLPPNSNTCPVCLGLPGSLPVPNKKAIEWCIMLGLALNCQIPETSKFDRKNYFYPDLPKGYQISQYDQPLAVNGWLEIKNSIKTTGDKDTSDGGEATTSTPPRWRNRKRIRIRRVHMEEDTGKLLHEKVNGENVSLVDFNRSGVPLVEIVTEPDIRSSEEARIFLKKLHQIIRNIGISDADMEKGSMRLEPNISVRPIKHLPGSSKAIKTPPRWPEGTPRTVEESELPPYKVEVKNINSFNFAKKAIDFEIERHIDILDSGKIPVQETRGYDGKKGVTYSQRSKEEAHDYRYFPEPDIPPMRWTKDQIRRLADQIPELPDQKIKRFTIDYSLTDYDAALLTDEWETAEYFEKAVSVTKGVRPSTNSRSDPKMTKMIANWIINKRADITKVSPEELVKLISQKTQSVQMDEKELEQIIKKVLSDNPKAVSDYQSGKQQAIMFLLGQVMKETRGQTDAAKAKEKLIKLLAARKV